MSRIAVGDRELADVVEQRPEAHRVGVGRAEPEAPGDAGGELLDALAVAVQRAVALLEGDHERLRDLAARPDATSGLVLVHADVRAAQRVARRRGLAREQHDAVGGGHGEPACGGRERLRGAFGDRVVIGRAGVDQHAELVAAHAVCAADPVDGLGEVAAERRQQRVAGRMAVRVVVVLEAVEVEERERCRRRLGGALDLVLEVHHELAPVAEAGERVGHRVGAGDAQHPVVVVQRDREPPDDDRERARRAGQRRG